MRKRKSKAFRVVLAVLVLAALMPIAAFAAETADGAAPVSYTHLAFL